MSTMECLVFLVLVAVKMTGLEGWVSAYSYWLLEELTLSNPPFHDGTPVYASRAALCQLFLPLMVDQN